MADEPLVDREYNQDLDVEGRIKQGYILARLYIEVQGNDQEAAQKALETTIFGNLVDEKYVDVLRVKFYDIREDEEEEDVFSGVAEVKILFRDFRWFINIVMRYGPSAIEIIEPHSIKLSLDEMHAILGDVSEVSQSFASQIMTLLKDDERRQLYKQIVSDAADQPID